MTRIDPSETLLTGRWIAQGSRVAADDVCKRIIALTQSHLHKIGADDSGWTTLYRDPSDGRYWQLSYPQSELHGGGPPELRCLTAEEAIHKYGSQLVKS
jgi:Immunity protein 27